MDYKKHIASKLKIEGFTPEDIEELLCFPPNTEMGDYALPCFKLSKVFRKPPAAIAEELKAQIEPDGVLAEASALSGYLNFKIDRKSFVRETLSEVLKKGGKYGSDDIGGGRTVCIDYSSINIAKPFHIGHLSTTVIGGALYRIFNFLGFKAVGINHLGDWGTQFGKLISAYKRWGVREVIEGGGVRELVKLYVKFHEEAEKNAVLEDEARAYFKRIEDGDRECTDLFNWFKEITLKDVEKIYDLLGVKFDSYAGESFYNDKMQPVIDELKEKGLLTESEGAKIVNLEEYGMPPCLILKADGATLYATRDLAAAFYRKKTYDFYKCLYVVAYQQNLHFKQIFKVLELMGAPFYKDMEHVAFGMVSLEEGTMSTRKGKVVFLEDVLNKSIEKSLKLIDEKNPALENKEDTAKAVGVGAVIFGTLYNSRIKDIVFSYDKALNFEGETGPYVQYTAARCNSVLEKAGAAGDYRIEELTQEEYEVANVLSRFPSAVKSAAEKYEPSFIARYAIELAKAYNKFYFQCKILDSGENTRNFRLALTKGTHIALKNALGLLGIGAPEKM